MYIELYYGKEYDDDEPEIMGPVIGPIDYFQSSYFTMLKIGKKDFEDGHPYTFESDGEFIFIDGIKYADFAIYDQEPAANNSVVSLADAIERGWLEKF